MYNLKCSISAAALLSAIALSACAPANVSESAADPTPATPPKAVMQRVSIYDVAVQNSNRPAADRDRDGSRKPAEVMRFFGIKPGMTVLDMFTGGGYYAELLSYVVGPQGKVIAQSNQAYMDFVGDEFEKRFADNRLPNVDILMAENNELSLDADTIDVVMMVLSYHDLYLEEEDGWPRFDTPAFLAELRKGLKPGGKVAIIDHVAAAGADATESGNSVHRIDPAVVIADMTAAGFKLGDRTDLLRNPDDDLSKLVFAEGIRGNTDRFVLCFSSPD